MKPEAPVTKAFHVAREILPQFCNNAPEDSIKIFAPPLDLSQWLGKTARVVCRSKAVPEKNRAAPAGATSASKSSSWRGWSAAIPITWTRCNCWATTTRSAAATPMASRWMNISRDLEPRSPLVFYNLACSCSLTGQFDRAASALETALQLGYRDFRWLAKDPDLHQLRQQPIYRDIEAKIRRMKVKVG